MVNDELETHVDDEIIWTNSKIFLKYINSDDVCQFKEFAANRVQQITERKSPKQWHYVKRRSSSEDDAARGMDSKKKDQIKKWFDGPLFLRSRKHCWLGKRQLEEVSDEDLQKSRQWLS